MENFTLLEIAKRLSLEGEFEGIVEGFSYDSREIKKGWLFFALKGEKSDGHSFLKEVAMKGGIGAVVSKTYCGDNYGLKLLKVEDVLQALQFLAADFIKEKKIQIIGITGSVGKTTIKDFTATLLSSKYKVAKSESSYNSQISFPTNLLNMCFDAEILVLEYGMSQKGEIKRLVDIAPPDVALISKVALAHAMNFPDGLAGIAKAKSEIFSHPKTKVCLVNHYLLSFQGLFPENKITFSTIDPEADFFLHMVNETSQVDEKGIRSANLHFPFKELHFQEDFLAAAAICRSLGMNWQEIELGVDKLKTPHKRFEKVELKKTLFINDSYNANPASVKAALHNLPPPLQGNKTIAVLGSMKELGSFSEECHRDIGKEAIGFVDYLLCLGQECNEMCAAFKESKKPAELFPNHESLVERLKNLITPGDVVLVKGSKSLEMWRVLELMKKPDID